MSQSREINDRIHEELWKVFTGEKPLWRVPTSLQAWWHVAYEEGRRSREPELRAAKLAADRLYLEAFAPLDRREFLLDRLDQAMQDADSDDVDELIAGSLERFLSGLEQIRGAA